MKELFPGGDMHNASLHLKWSNKLLSWRNFFLFFDRMTHWFERVHLRPLRSLALKKAERWMLDHFEKSDGLGAIYPAMMNAIIALRCLGYADDSVEVLYALKQLDEILGRIQARVTDQGAGFDPDAVPDPTCPENLTKPCGRGLFLMRKLMDEVYYEPKDDKSNVLTMIKRKR